MNYFVLIGIAIIIVGFIFKLDVVAVVLISGLVTGLIAKMGLVEVLNAIGTGFVNNRYMSLFFISFPVIAIMERYGLKLRAAEFIRKIKGGLVHRPPPKLIFTSLYLYGTNMCFHIAVYKARTAVSSE